MLIRPVKSEAKAGCYETDAERKLMPDTMRLRPEIYATYNLSIPRNHSQYGSHNSVNALFKS